MGVGRRLAPKAERFSFFRSVENQGERVLCCSCYAELWIQTIFAGTSLSNFSGSNLGSSCKRDLVGRRDKP